MKLYIEEDAAGVYGLLDTFDNESISLNTKTTYTQDITAVFKGFTNSFSAPATPNNIKRLGYFGFTDRFVSTSIEKRAKLYLDNGMLFKTGIITLENTSLINDLPSLFELSFSDGQKNLTETVGDDTLADLGNGNGNVFWTTKNIQNGLQAIQTGSGGVRWFIPLVSVERIISISNSADALPTDNINYNASKPITSENVLLPQEVRPAMFVSEILEAINNKYDIEIDPTPFVNNITQLTDLCTMCVSANVAIREAKAVMQKSMYDYDRFREERFDIILKPLINAFELNYIGYGSGSSHRATFDMLILLNKLSFVGANASYINNIEVWEVLSSGEKKKKLNYTVSGGSETKSNYLRIRIGLDVFTPEGANEPSTLIKPLISVFVTADTLSEWRFTNFAFNWSDESWEKGVRDNVQPANLPTSINLFQSLPEMKIIDFVKSIYTMFGFKKFKSEVLNEFYYKQKTIFEISHKKNKVENDLTPFADLSKLTKKTNTKYDGYNLKHATSDYQSNKAYLAANNMEYGQLKYPITGKPKSEFLIETKFTAPTFSPLITDADAVINTFYPFGTTAELNDIETRFIYETNVKELPIFYYNELANLSTPFGYVDTDLKQLKAIGVYHKISHRSSRIFTGSNNYITSLFNIITGDFTDQNTLYVQAYKDYIEDTLAGKKLIHTIDLSLPDIEIERFEDSQEIIIKETKYSILESTISLTDGKTKLILLNK